MSGCHDVRLELVGLVSGQLSAAETSALEAHLQACPACHAERAWITEVSAALGRLAVPPATLEGDTFALLEHDEVARALERAVPAAGPPVDLERRALARAATRRLGRAAALGGPLAAAAALVLAFAGASWRSRAEDLERRVAEMRSSFGTVGEPLQTVDFAALTTPPAETQGQLMTYEDHNYRLVLKAHDLPPTPPGYHYEVWLLGPQGRVLCGTFTVTGRDDDIVLSFPIGVDPSRYSSIDVVLERDDDDPGIHGEPVLQAVLTPGPALLATPKP